MVRTEGDPSSLIGPIRETLVRMDPTAVLADPMPMATVIEDSFAGFRVIMLSLGAFAGVALLLAAIGLYGVLAYNVSQRTHEIGIRLAMGAGQADLIGMVLRRGLVLVGVGLLFGVAGAIPGTLLLRQLLFETQTLEPSIYAAAVMTLGLVAVLACFLPAWRATRVDVVEVLKRE
jgi:putative ABC transport system permease protein